MFPSHLPHTTQSTIKTSPKLVNFCVCLYCFNCLNCLYCLHCLYCLYCLNCLYCLCCLNCLYYLYCLYCLYCLNCLNCLIHSYCTRCGKVCNGKFEVKKHIINNMWLNTDPQTDRHFSFLGPTVLHTGGPKKGECILNNISQYGGSIVYWKLKCLIIWV